LVHAQRVGRDVVEGLLSQIPEIQLVPLPGSERCCGAGGIYNLLQQDLASAILAEKVAALLTTGAEAVATGNPGCAMQWEFGLRGQGVAVRHPVEILNQAFS
jgi:glycolate oxidase iron-sulfur subunit